MLKLENISKSYTTGSFTQVALDDVTVSFRECEFASILGPSGSGKTTLLNIIGGLDHYDSGDLTINDISTKKYKDRDWDSYRNHRIGFVFQSYNLISHQSVLANVKLALTLSGISKKEATRRAKKALKDVGLEQHMYKRPNQLSGGQMQRVAIARALVNDPDILLADEPTGALDSDTSVQIMKLLKEISETKLVVMVTHNPDLAKEYSTRIIKLKDGRITSDSNPFKEGKKRKERIDVQKKKKKKTNMSRITAFGLSFNNLLTKKARTILVALAGSIGIIGIALIMAVSNGFQNYIDSIQEETLESYPLSIMQESMDFTGALLSMTSSGGENNNTGVVTEQQYITNILSSVSTNDLKSFRKYIDEHYSEIDKDVSSIQYRYSIDPLIYTVDATDKLSQLNPSSLYDSMLGGSSNLLSSYSNMSSVYSQMTDNVKSIEDDYTILAGTWPQRYDEIILVLSEPNGISDLLVYSLGLRDYDELTTMITKIMSGERVDINNTPMKFTYDDLMKIDLRLLMPSDRYKYNSKYDVYEDMSKDKKYMEKLYDKALKLKVVGIVTAKEGVTSTALRPGVNYTSELVRHIIDYSKDQDVVKKQLANDEVDVFSGKRFDDKKNKFDFAFADLVKVDSKKLQEAFNIKIDQQELQNQTENYMKEIANSITTDTTPAKKLFNDNLNTFINGLLDSIDGEFSQNDIDTLVKNYLSKKDVVKKLVNMKDKYVVPTDAFSEAYSGVLKGLLQAYVTGYNAYMPVVDPTYVVDEDNPKAILIPELKSTIVDKYVNSAPIKGVAEEMAKVMTEAKVKTDVIKKVGELTGNLTSKFATAFNVDQNKIVSAFTLNFSEDELARVVKAMMNPTESTAKSNLIQLGYQDLEEPTIMDVYFTSFDGKEHFLDFIEKYNDKVDEDKEINYTDTTGILMSFVKTVVNAVSYVLIAFVSISLVVSSIMIGVITYISVYERTKEIGILRAIGASKKNISTIFNAETFIIGLLAGLFGIGISYALIPIINAILHHFTGNIPLVVSLKFSSAIGLVILSVILTLIGGLIPAKKASKKDPVEALRTE